MKRDGEVWHRAWMEDGDDLDDNIGNERKRGTSPESGCSSDRRIFVLCVRVGFCERSSCICSYIFLLFLQSNDIIVFAIS